MSNEAMTSDDWNRSRTGFTLIEIMLVVIIIGILVSIAVVKMGDNAKKARITATEATIGTIKTAVAQFEMEQSKYPESLAQLVAGEKHYLDRETVPTDAWGKEFKYYLKGDLVKVQSAGPDGIFDDEDDIVNK